MSGENETETVEALKRRIQQLEDQLQKSKAGDAGQVSFRK